MKSPKNLLKETVAFIERFPWERSVLLFTGRGNSLLLLRILEEFLPEKKSGLWLVTFKNFPFFNYEALSASIFRREYRLKFMELRLLASKQKCLITSPGEIFEAMLVEVRKNFPGRIPVLAFDYEDTWKLWGATSVSKKYGAYRPFVSMRYRKRHLKAMIDYMGVKPGGESPPYFWLYIDGPEAVFSNPETNLAVLYRRVRKMRNFLLKFDCDAVFRIFPRKNILLLERMPYDKSIFERFILKAQKRNLEVYVNGADLLGFSGYIPGFPGSPHSSH